MAKLLDGNVRLLAGDHQGYRAELRGWSRKPSSNSGPRTMKRLDH